MLPSSGVENLFSSVIALKLKLMLKWMLMFLHWEILSMILNVASAPSGSCCLEFALIWVAYPLLTLVSIWLKFCCMKMSSYNMECFRWLRRLLLPLPWFSLRFFWSYPQRTSTFESGNSYPYICWWEHFGCRLDVMINILMKLGRIL